ncbi:hypothetical protein [Salibacterium halotolerans]|uniref:Uncharacterized protein n=1 Tax=Salibacterium halotolerans TaxID=1884432 RepID=A0A1I5NA22_9BACI|nr:hypothetical protein [Salibacterium halotolerans]SFP18619.1 hypothetical protein SAMN05518683_10355 [Salibacterium halotolerans]
MSVRVRDNNNIPKLIKALRELQSMKIEVGVFGEDDSHMLMIARVHEFGMDIKPKQSQYLTIPAHPKAHGKSAGEFKDLFFIETDDGSKLLAREKGKDEIEVYFVLVKSVSIPERSYVRSTYDEKERELSTNMEKVIQGVVDFKITPQQAYDRIGAWLVSAIQEKIRSIQSPPNANTTTEAKGSSNPLVDTGRLLQSITWKVVRE